MLLLFWFLFLFPYTMYEKCQGYQFVILLNWVMTYFTIGYEHLTPHVLNQNNADTHVVNNKLYLFN